MCYYIEEACKLKAYNQKSVDAGRYLNPEDINLSQGYVIDVVAYGLNLPIGMVFSEEGALYIAEEGTITGNPRVLRLSNGHIEVISENFNVPITGINHLDGNTYVSNKGAITLLRANGERQDILSGLPCNGDYGSSNVAFGPEGKIYFGLGTITNSGVVGVDNDWISDHPLMHDELAINSILYGQNFITNNMQSAGEESAVTGAFSAYGVPNVEYEARKGIVKASGSILRANRDGTALELVAWGLRNPNHIRFDREFHLFAANRGYDVRGSRPIANAPDEIHVIMPGIWYGWPDYCVGEPLTSPRFTPVGGRQPEFLLASHPGLPPRPYAEFPPHSSIRGFDFNYDINFASLGDIFVAEFGSFGPVTMGLSAPFDGIGFRVDRIDRNNGEVSTFINNKSGLPSYLTGEGGFGRLVDVKFSPEGDLYILDTGLSDRNNLEYIYPNTGVIWRVTRKRRSTML